MRDGRRFLVLAATALLAACQSSDSVSCSLDGGTELPPTPAPTPSVSETPSSTWPNFRADIANTGRTTADLTQSAGNGVLLFDGFCGANGMQITPTQTCTVDDPDPNKCPPGQTCVRIGPVSTTPIVGLQPSMGMPCAAGLQSIFVAAADGNVYVYCDGQPAQLTDPIQVRSAIIGSPLLGADGTLFVPSNGQLSQFMDDGTLKTSAALLGFVAASPNIWTDGTVFIATQSGSFTGVCPNGVARFGPLSSPPTQSTAALAEDPNFPMQDTPIIVVGGLNGQVRAYSVRGRQYWSFFASANVVAAVLIDPTTNLFYVADTSGHVYAGYLVVQPARTPTPDPENPTPGPGTPPTGQLYPSFSFAADASITASPALGRDSASIPKLYVADEGRYPERGGMLYALNRATGEVCWTFTAEGPIRSSPAVAIPPTTTEGANDVIVFAADILAVLDPAAGPVAVGGRVYAVQEDDQCDGGPRPAMWTFPQPPDTGYSIGASSPSIGPDGTVYIGRTGSRLGAGDECPTGAPCLVNDGGALYAISP